MICLKYYPKNLLNLCLKIQAIENQMSHITRILSVQYFITQQNVLITFITTWNCGFVINERDQKYTSHTTACWPVSFSKFVSTWFLMQLHLQDCISQLLIFLMLHSGQQPCKGKTNKSCSIALSPLLEIHSNRTHLNLYWIEYTAPCS